MTAYLFDKELELRDGGSAASTSTHTTAAKALDLAKAGAFKAVINVTAIDRAQADEVYTFTVETDDNAGFTSAKTVATLPALTAVGIYEIPLSGDFVRQHDSAATHIRLRCTISGTTPSITYGAFLVPAV